jgi:quinoprotein glucose dehydrogenase
MLLRLLCLLFATAALGAHADWTHYGADAGGTRYVPLTQIDRTNVEDLGVAWQFSAGYAETQARWMRVTKHQTTPILIRDKLIFCTPFDHVIALNPGSGEKLWEYDAGIDTSTRVADFFVCRGVSYWQDHSAPEGRLCKHRVFMGTLDARVVAVDVDTGKACTEFGANGSVSVDPGLPLIKEAEYYIASAPTVIGDVVATGSSIADNVRADAPRGTVFGFDARTGDVRWTFDPIPEDPAAVGLADSWQNGSAARTGHANVWSTMSADEDRDLLFVPTSSPSPDFYGGERPGDNRYANSLVALRGSTGEVVWHFQTVHHDVWDYDVASQPNLVTIERDGQRIPAVIQPTKTGFVFAFNRETGEPLWPIEERPVPKSDVPGEVLSPTQPFPTKPPPLVPQHIDAEDGWGMLYFDGRACRQKLAALRNEGIFTPPSLQGTVLFPMTGGGANWGSGAWDPERQYLFINTNRAVHVVTLMHSEQYESARKAQPDVEISPQLGTPYAMKREVLFSPLGVPCNPPPWGMLTAVDMVNGEIVWESVLGTTRDLISPIALNLGMPNFGGVFVTKSGLVFIGATHDNYLRAFDADSGEELWKGRLPAGGQATPMSYEFGGRQYVVIAAGGHPDLETTTGDYIVAFALPEE